MGLPFSPSCLPLPRAGAPPAGGDAISSREVGAPGIASLAQRRVADSALALGVAGFPGVTLEGERAWVSRPAAERAIDRVGLAYLRGERAAGAPPGEQLLAATEQLRHAEQGRPRAVKAEILGPVSLALQVTDEQERPLAYDPPLRESIAQHVALRAAWVRDLIESAGLSALILLDEPFLDALGSPFCPLDWEEGGDLLARTLATIPGSCGVCASGSPRWEAALTLPADILFFDAYEHGPELVQAAGQVVAYLGQGGALGWGVVPTEPPTVAQEQAATLARRFVSLVEYLSAAGGVAPELVAARSLVSTSGSLGHLPTQQAAHAAALCAAVSAEARAHFRLEA